MIAAMIIPKVTFDDLYERTAYGDVIEKLALALAAKYQPPKEEGKKGPT